MFEQEEGGRRSGFGVNPRPDHLWDGEHAFGFEAAHGSRGNHEYQSRSRSQRFDAQMSQKIENTNMIDLSKVLMTRQQVALKMKCSLDQLKLVLKSSGQSNGFQVEKIYLFGAIWTENQTIQLSETTIQTELTRVYLEWVHQDDTEGFWTFPVYSTAERSDLVFELNVNPSNSESLDQYRQRAVAFHLY